MLVETFIENLTKEVEKRPALYKKNHSKEYSDVNQKKKLWVRETVVLEWKHFVGKFSSLECNVATITFLDVVLITRPLFSSAAYRLAGLSRAIGRLLLADLRTRHRRPDGV